ncbi:BPSL0067 family protein [Ferrovibrio sp.]|uniref:BPSL0067 family protein n=1 Tax=Ferrovibrio sp. TaxID=1917215 RepID=UPI0035B09BD0
MTQLPDPLTEASLTAMMRDPRYWHPTQRDPAFQQVVTQGFRQLYPETRRDATGRLIRMPPREGPQNATGQQGNSSGSPVSDGRVQVDAYSRHQDGQRVQVSDHTRAAPGQGGKAAGPRASQQTLDAIAKAGTWVGESRECVALVKHALPQLGPTHAWRPGANIKGPNDPPLQPGTPIATFDKTGRYPSKSTGQHAAIFLGYGKNAEGQDGIRVLDQARDFMPKETFIPFGRPAASVSASRRAEAFSEISTQK